MKLKSMTIENFRCYRAPLTVAFSELTTLVGRNDAGKSTLLDALDAFFNDRPLDKHDASKGGNPRDVRITCTFDSLPESVVLDEAVPTSLSEEGLLNELGELEICKVFNCSIEKPKVTAVQVRVQCPAGGPVSDLLSLKIDQLRERAATLRLDLARVNRSIKRDLRAALRERLNGQEHETHALLLVGDGVDEKGNLPKVWDGLRAALPLFALFKSDRQSTDQDIEAQDPLKIAIKEALAAKATELQDVLLYVESEVKKVADLTLAKLQEMDPAVASTLDPKFERPNWASLIKASITGDGDIPLNKRGSGVRRLILLNFFRAKAERLVREKSAHSTIFAIEEPETSQHPHNQRMLVRSLQQLSVGDDQVIVTTHTPNLARAMPALGLRFVSRDANDNRNVSAGGTEEINRSIAESLGVLPDNAVKVFVVVEGVHDITLLKSLCRMFREHGRPVPDLDALEMSGEVIFVPSGGSGNLALWASRLHALNRPEFHIYDRDAAPEEPAAHQIDVDAVNARPNCRAVSTSRREMENYVHHEAVNICARALNLPCAIVQPFDYADDVPAQLVTILNAVAPRHDKWGQNRVKGWLAATVIPSMTEMMVQEVDPDGEMLGWIDAIQAMLRANA